MVSDKEIVLTLNDILLELNDLRLTTRVGNVRTIGPTSFSFKTSYCDIYIGKIVNRKEELFKGSEVADVIERVYYFMKDNGWSMWIDAHLYTDYHYNNGYLIFKHLLPGRSTTDYKNRLEDYFDIFRFEMERGLKSVIIHFEKTHY